MKAQIKRRAVSEEAIEAKSGNLTSEFTDLGKQFTDSLWKDFLGKGVQSIPEQIFGLSGSEQTLSPGEEVNLKNKKEEKKPVSSEHMQYFRKVESADTAIQNKENYKISQQVDEIRLEIRKLVKTSKIVEQTVKGAVAENAPVKPGKYHVSFFEFVLDIIKDATRKLEDSVSFGAIFQSKKRQKQHWTQNKKLGTQFGLSGERSTATQTG